MIEWKSKNVKPIKSDWYATASFNYKDYVVPRYYDYWSDEWYIARSNGGGDSIHGDDDCDPPLVINTSFDVWHPLPKYPNLMEVSWE